MRVLLMISVMLFPGAAVRAQRLADIVPVATPLFGNIARTNPVAAIFTTGAPDHRWEGFAIGALILGATGAIAGSQLCRLSDSADQHCARAAVGLGLLGALAGGITGGLMGGAIPKGPPETH